ncbi:MAG: acetate kinase [Rickettsiales bacterium]|jgi:acetate kinase
MKILVINAGSSSIKFSIFDEQNQCQISKIHKIFANIEFEIKGIIKILKDNGFDNFDVIGHNKK